MTDLSIETGQKGTATNSYITVAEYNTYLSDRYPSRSNASDANAKSYIFRAMSYFESLSFKGYKASDDQALQFPRSELVIDGYGIDSDEIPIEVKESIYELAYSVELGNAADDPVSRETISESVGGISVTYKNSSAARTISPATTNALRKIIKSPTRVVRA